MQLRLRTKLTLITTGLIFLVSAMLSLVFLVRLMDQDLSEANQRASELAQQVFQQAQQAISDARARGEVPASSDARDVHEYVRQSFEASERLQSQLDAAKGASYIYEVSITDKDGLVLVSTDKTQPGNFESRHIPISQLIQKNYVKQLALL